mmetsp:Transcript_19311/g.31171  ORF Transcript_19311/g.31171 Transcript_19311/m.31171 type:complete len:417 (+) Transcript_19311:124-1374(+)
MDDVSFLAGIDWSDGGGVVQSFAQSGCSSCPTNLIPPWKGTTNSKPRKKRRQLSNLPVAPIKWEPYIQTNPDESSLFNPSSPVVGVGFDSSECPSDSSANSLDSAFTAQCIEVNFPSPSGGKNPLLQEAGSWLPALSFFQLDAEEQMFAEAAKGQVEIFIKRTFDQAKSAAAKVSLPDDLQVPNPLLLISCSDSGQKNPKPSPFEVQPQEPKKKTKRKRTHQIPPDMQVSTAVDADDEVVVSLRSATRSHAAHCVRAELALLLAAAQAGPASSHDRGEAARRRAAAAQVAADPAGGARALLQDPCARRQPLFAQVFGREAAEMLAEEVGIPGQGATAAAAPAAADAPQWVAAAVQRLETLPVGGVGASNPGLQRQLAGLARALAKRHRQRPARPCAGGRVQRLGRTGTCNGVAPSG